MSTIPQRIASAFAVLWGRYGDVTKMARGRQQSRPSLYREAEPVANTADGAAAQTRIDELRRRLAQRGAEIQALQKRLKHTVEIAPDRRDEFAPVAPAEGVSLSVARRLSQVMAGSHSTPRVATPGRATLGAGARAGAGPLLQVLDEEARPEVERAFSCRSPASVVPKLAVGSSGGCSWAHDPAGQWVRETDPVPGGAMRPPHRILDRQKVHHLAAAHLQAHLQSRGSKRKTPARTLRALLLAAARITSSSDACPRPRDAPCAEAGREALLATLADAATLPRRLDAAPAAYLPGTPRKRRQRRAIDLPAIRDHGKPSRAPSEMYRGRAKDGTSHVHASATASVPSTGSGPPSRCPAWPRGSR